MIRIASKRETGAVTLERGDLDRLFAALREDGYELVGPTVRDGAIIYDTIESADDLPAGVTDRQAAASYRLADRADQACFGYVVGPHSWKRYLFAPKVRLWSARRTAEGLGFDNARQAPRRALIGVRACELAAIEIQDKVFLRDECRDADYASRRENTFLVAVNCAEAGGNCFCVSMDTGPTARSGYDLVLTEILEPGRHYFVMRSGSDAGRAMLERLGRPAATDAELGAATKVEQRAAERMGRHLDTDGLPQVLEQAARHRHWDDVAERCMSCDNCTMVCPTCFCHVVEDKIDLGGEHAERWREWDSCFNGDYSKIHGGKIRRSIRSRYRQWLTHKLGTWHRQFGVSGCVGCGRCITWCPVGIDLTAEVSALRRRSDSQQESPS